MVMFCDLMQYLCQYRTEMRLTNVKNYQNCSHIGFFHSISLITYGNISIILIFFVNIMRKENAFTLQKSTAYIYIHSVNRARKIICILEKKDFYAFKYILHQNKFHYFLIYISLHKSSNMIMFTDMLTLYLIKMSYKFIINLCFIITF